MPDLPFELINMILSYRPPHPNSVEIKNWIDDYNEELYVYENDDDYIDEKPQIFNKWYFWKFSIYKKFACEDCKKINNEKNNPNDYENCMLCYLIFSAK